MGYFQPYVFKQITIWIRIKDLKGRQIYRNQQWLTIQTARSVARDMVYKKKNGAHLHLKIKELRFLSVLKTNFNIHIKRNTEKIAYFAENTTAWPRCFFGGLLDFNFFQTSLIIASFSMAQFTIYCMSK